MPRTTEVNGETRIRVWVPWEMDPTDHADLLDYCKANDTKPRDLLLKGAKELVHPILDEWRALAPQRAAEAAANPAPPKGRKGKTPEELAAIVEAKVQKEQEKAAKKAEHEQKKEAAAAERKQRAEARTAEREAKAAAKAAAQAEKLAAKQAKIEAELAEKQAKLDAARAKAQASAPAAPASPAVENLEMEVIDDEDPNGGEPSSENDRDEDDE